MKKTRRIVTIAAAAVAMTASLTPAASAQNIGGFLGDANQAIDNFNCSILRTGLTQAGLVTNDTTRGQLAKTLKSTADLSQVDPILGLLGNTYSERIANRALTCGIVKADPQQDILTQLQNFSSNLSSGFLPAK